jgi:hypothetical protein
MAETANKPKILSGVTLLFPWSAASFHNHMPLHQSAVEELETGQDRRSALLGIIRPAWTLASGQA